MALDDVFECAVTYAQPGADGELVNVLHYRQTTYDGVSSITAMGDLVSAQIIAGLDGNYMTSASDTLTLERVDWFAVTDPTFGGSVVSGTVGIIVSEALSIRSAPVIKKITAQRGRKFQGRWFMPTVTEDQQTRGIMNATIIGVLEGLAATLRVVNDGPEDNIFQMTVYSRKLSTPPAIVVDTLVTGFVVNPVLGSVRGRQKVT